MQLAFYFDQSRCSGCFTCVVACKDWHDIPAGPASWIRITTIEKGRFPSLSVSFLVHTCYHCAKPSCVSACPEGAITKCREDGIVMVDREACLGSSCRMCQEACPYHSPQFGPEPEAKMQKCDLCADKWAKDGKPVCVESCPLRALDAGPLVELESKYGKFNNAAGFSYSEENMPSVVFKPKDR